MINKPLISCIIIFFNAGEKFFVEAIESVFAQTYENWELLLVDDGSTDVSTNIALSYTQKSPEKVRYLEHKGHQNRGMSATRNLGIRHAKGEYITFLDADDIWIPQTLEEQAAILDSHPEAAMVYGPIQWWYSWTGNPQDMKRDFLDIPIVTMKDFRVQIDTKIQPPMLFLLSLKMKICISGMLVRRQVIEKVGGFEETFRGLYEDQVFSTKVCLQFPVFVASKFWYKYRQHPNSCCHTAAEQKGKEYAARLNFLNWLEQYLIVQGIKDGKLWGAFRKEKLLVVHPILYFLFHKTRYLKWKIKKLSELQTLLTKRAIKFVYSYKLLSLNRNETK
ncbi:glycosyltransferase family 2 protein [Dendronalium sp. ChiSLP03b]|uniref:glycosyltransferase family 2 protein n=1 Tax=Dendronalium sp. ChiSLP03b TaxID=3075381 RepID=UPI002AD329CE|nr:glycosyltransferase family 2 protein [Dendronalium sp. ChiSLP03b]MDZ8206530.1 glycosyltransferase family 2 protein [Dendronalium sp. ChiSLP03b]